MSPVTHFLLSWAVANIPRGTTRRDRALITVGGIIPDLDGLGAIPDQITTHLLNWEVPTRFFHEYHHDLHTGLFAGIVFLLALALARKGRRWSTAALVLFTFHLHLLCDIAGAQGPDGSPWPIPYLFPFNNDPAYWLTWSGQWELNAWPNMVITAAALLLAGFLGVRRGYSFLELFNRRLDGVVVTTLRARFGGGTDEADEPEPEPAEGGGDDGGSGSST